MRPENPKSMTVDVETTGLDFMKDVLHGIGVGYEEDDAQYYPAWSIPIQVRRDLENPKINKVGHNLHSFDAKFIRRAGINIQGLFDDTMILANLYDDSLPLGLKFLSDKFIGEGSLENKRALDQYMSANGVNNIAQLCAKDLVDPEHPHKEIIAAYCSEDVNNTTTLCRILKDKLRELDRQVKAMGFKKSPIDYYIEEARPLETVLFETEYRGIRVDLSVAEKIKQEATSAIAEIEVRLNKVFINKIALIEQELYEKEIDKLKDEKAKSKRAAGQGKCKFSWSNSNHFAILLYRHCGLSKDLVLRTAKGKYRTDKSALEIIRAGLQKENRLLIYLNLYSKLKLHQKIASTYTGDAKTGILSKVRYINGIPRIYPNYRQTTGTGRLAGSNPNMQNIKRDSNIKKFFIPDTEGEVFDSADYSQIELRTGAHISQDASLCNAYIDGLDVHLITASRLFAKTVTKEDDLERQAGKRTNFLTIFDGGAFRLQAALKADTGHDFTEEECKEFIKIWFDTYPGVRAYLDSQLEFFHKWKMCISETGRIRRLPDIAFGEYLEWHKNPDPSGRRWLVTFNGPKSLKEKLIEGILKENRQLKRQDIDSNMIGQAASKRYKHAIKAGYNQPIQGLAASMTKRAMIKLHRLGRKIANQVHDELVVARKLNDLAAKEQVIDVMENVYKLTVPVKVDLKTVSTFHADSKVKEIYGLQ